MKDARVDRGDGEFRDATVVAFDPRDDVAVLRVQGLGAPPLGLVDPVEGRAVAILGYPENGPFTATAGRIGQTGAVLTARRLRARGGPAACDDAARRRPARELRRACGRRAGARADDDLRRAHRLGRAATACRRRSSARRSPTRARARSRPGPASWARGRRGCRAAGGTARRGRRPAAFSRASCDQLARELAADLRRVGARRAQPLLHRLGDDDSRNLVVDPHARAGRLGSGQTPTSSGIGELPPKCARNESRYVRSKSTCVIANCAPASSLRSNRSSSRSMSSADGLTATPTKKDVGASIAAAVVVLAAVQAGDRAG